MKKINILRVIVGIWAAIPAFSHAQVLGCTDPLAQNYNPAATQNNGSCTYAAASIDAKESWVLGDSLKETSGLILWNGALWTHNDDTDLKLYALDTSMGTAQQSVELSQCVNTDWEEISQDSLYVYVGDFGNNSNGNRKDLHILRLLKSALALGNTQIDTLFFSYSDQTDFGGAGANNTNFDCEAMVVAGDSIFLFTKEWLSLQTHIYALPKVPGTHLAQRLSGYDVQGLVTGASLVPCKQALLLTGYSTFLQPFLLLCYDFKGTQFFSGNKRKVALNLPFHQIEGVASNNGLTAYLSNEAFSKSSINVAAQVHRIDLTSFLGDFIHPKTTGFEKTAARGCRVFPIPTQQYVRLDFPVGTMLPSVVRIFDVFGRMVLEQNITASGETLDVSTLSSGNYGLHVISQNGVREALFIQIER